MGQEISRITFSEEDFRLFRNRLIAETAVLQAWMEEGVLERGEFVGGSEIEAWLITPEGLPAAANDDFLARMNHPMVVPELSRFNVELNNQPRVLGAQFLQAMYQDLAQLWQQCRIVAAELGLGMLMTGILPTVEQRDLVLENMSGMQRYRALNEQILRMRDGEPLRLDIRAAEHLQALHYDVMLEAATTSFQIHLQVPVHRAVLAYNLSKMIAGPLVALSANSPYLFGRDLWDETRIPLFEQSVAVGASDYSKRVTFGVRYAEHSIMECFIANRDRYPILLPQISDEPLESLAHLRLHNGTIWRWNRPLIGFSDTGAVHVRIEHRVVPSGPSPLDVVANAAFYFGLLRSLMDEEQRPESRLPFRQARDNFYRCAYAGLDAQVHWFDGMQGSLTDLCTQRLFPQARRGLQKIGVDNDEIEFWLRILQGRLEKRQTGARWQRRWVARHGRDFPALVQAQAAWQDSGKAVYEWQV